ncbi:hypothetical protein QQF64_002534 [Cirrhinus molitorella]|uniref:Uncharacterized protein n=1 Tax=Cirrhinus molitorella TaxID=172907 RepID=A0ABR3MQG2_9TELE
MAARIHSFRLLLQSLAAELVKKRKFVGVVEEDCWGLFAVPLLRTIDFRCLPLAAAPVYRVELVCASRQAGRVIQASALPEHSVSAHTVEGHSAVHWSSDVQTSGGLLFGGQ